MAGSSRYIRSEAAEIVRRLRGLEERPSIREDKITGEPRVAAAVRFDNPSKRAFSSIDSASPQFAKVE
jgi:hypothetical protein